MFDQVLAVVLMGVVALIVWYWKYVIPLLNLLQLLLTVKLFGFRNAGTNYTIVDFFEKKCDENPNRVAMIMAETGEKRTIGELDALANQLAHFLQQQGLRSLDTVALMMLNSVNYPAMWLGMAKCGISTALCNTNLIGKPFLHSVHTSLAHSDKKILILDYDLVLNLEAEIKELCNRGIKIFVWKNDFVSGDELENQMSLKHTPIINHQITALPTTRLSKAAARGNVKESDPLLFIFTSGTTGLPKACKITHTRFTLATYFFPLLCALTTNDVLYCPLPLYHSAAGMIALGGCLRGGAALLSRKKFSASSFAKDCVKYHVTAVQYIGELCRYLVNLPEQVEESRLSIRVAFGNGMRREYWNKFQQRYHVDKIVEFYAATEGNVGLINATGQEGALGFIPRFLDFIYPLKLVKVDEDSGAAIPIRTATGLCVASAVNEPGLLLSQLNSDAKEITRRFEGYTDAKATNEKILRDVFVKGDMYFNTGDLLTRDEVGFFYWCDRIGDTFRWKGENCSTTEVSHVLSECESQIADVVVYGVSVPHCDGKAGMACIVTKNEQNVVHVEAIETVVNSHLPLYARPLFIRVRHDRVLPVTSTHKYVKTDLVKESFDPSKCGEDVLFYYNASKQKYVPLDGQVYDDINNQKIRL